MGIHHGFFSVQPATRWEDALPTGNGSIGALVYGSIALETIVVNHEALWIQSEKPEPPDISDSLPELREMLTNGEWAFTEVFLNVMLAEQGYTTTHTDPYLPAFDIKITTPPSYPFRDYRRAIDFETGVATVHWEEGGVQFVRDCFVSRADDVICLRITCPTRAEKINCGIKLARRGLVEENMHNTRQVIKEADVPLKYFSNFDERWYRIFGEYEDCSEFGGIARVIAQGGTIECVRDEIAIKGATEVLCLVKVFAKEPAENAVPRIEQELEAMPRDFDTLLSRHEALHRPLFHRADVEISPESENDLSVDQLLLNSYNGDVHPALIQLLYEYGRYLLISSSRPGGWPANLQGVWNGNYFPAWSSDYHNDENIQMNYWAALPGNLAETTLPYFDYYEAAIPDFRRNAQVLFNCQGIFVPIAQAVKGEAPLYGGPWLNWTAGAGWLAQLFYDYYLFTRDLDFLRDRAIPFLREVALFYKDFLYKDSDGKYVVTPSLSPENVPDIPGGCLATINATMDIAVAKEVISNLCRACDILGEKDDHRPEWDDILANLPPYTLNEDGAIREWNHPDLKDNYHHRHMSHLYPLFPGYEITAQNNPKLFEGCRVAVEKRQVIGQDSQSGWSWVHMANVYARLHDGERALVCLENLVRSCVGPNLFTYHNDWRHQGLSLYWGFLDRIFQIDANFGLTAAILEMLVFSNDSTIQILPALPAKWTKGHARGLLTRCGVGIDVSWDRHAGKVIVDFRSASASTFLLGMPGEIMAIKPENLSARITKSEQFDGFWEVKLDSDQKITIEGLISKSQV